MSGIIINEDCTHFIYTRHFAGIKVDESVLRDFISQYKNTQVTDLVINPNGMMSFCPSKVRETALDKFIKYKQAGKVDESNAYCQILYDVYIEQGLDMYAIWFDQCRKDGITSWLSVRMNDCHVNDLDDHILLTEHFKKNKHLRRVTHHAYDNYFNNCIDYGQEQARQYYLDYIQECLNNYDFDGLELDWMREIFCFKLGQETKGVQIINDFTRTVKAMVETAAKKRGHAIKLSVRLPHSPITALKLGFDVMTWIQQGLVDLIIPTPRWESTDNDMPIDFWKRLLHGTKVELAAGMEISLRPYPQVAPKRLTMEVAAAATLQYLSSGADKIYLFNYMDTLDDQGDNFNMIPVAAKNYQDFLKNFGSIDTLISRSRRHVVTYHDIEAPGIANVAILPLEINDETHRPVRIETGPIPQDKNITLIIAAKSDSQLTAADFSVFVNSAAAKFLGTTEVPLHYSDAPHYAFRVQNQQDFPTTSVAEFAAPNAKYTIEHVELRVD